MAQQPLLADRRPPTALKVVLLGPPGAGKTLLFRTRLPRAPPRPYSATAAADFCLFALPLAGRQQRVQLWDTPGDAALLPSTLGLLAGSHAAALVLDASSSASLAALSAQWLPAVAAACAAQQCALLLLGLAGGGSGAGARAVPTAEGHALAAAHGLAYLEVDAAAGAEAAFAALAEAALRAFLRRPSLGSSSSSSSSSSSVSGGACCPCCSTQ